MLTSDVLGVCLDDDFQAANRDPQPLKLPIHGRQEEESPSLLSLELDHVPGLYRDRLRKMLGKYSCMWSGHLGEIAATEHHIDLVTVALPVSQAPYRAGPWTREIEEENVQSMLAKDVIEPAQSAWASPVVLAPKPDGS